MINTKKISIFLQGIILYSLMIGFSSHAKETSLANSSDNPCSQIFSQLEELSLRMSTYTNEPELKQLITDKNSHLSAILAQLPEEKRNETCINMQTQIAAILPSLLELEAAARKSN